MSNRNDALRQVQGERECKDKMHRLEIGLTSNQPDARGAGLVKDIHDLGISTVTDVRVVDLYWLDGDLAAGDLNLIGRNLLADPDSPRTLLFPAWPIFAFIVLLTC